MMRPARGPGCCDCADDLDAAEARIAAALAMCDIYGGDTERVREVLTEGTGQ